MYCWKCGKEIQDGAKFCSFCGAAATDSDGMSRDKGEKVQRDVRVYVVIGIIVVLILMAVTIAIGMLLPEEKTVEAEVPSETMEVAIEEKTAEISDSPAPVSGAEAAAARFITPEQYAEENGIKWPADSSEDYERDFDDLDIWVSETLYGDGSSLHGIIAAAQKTWGKFYAGVTAYMTPYLDARAEGKNDVEAHLIALEETGIDRQILGGEEFEQYVYGYAVLAGVPEYDAEEFAEWERYIWCRAWNIYKENRDNGSSHETASESVEWGCYVNTPYEYSKETGQPVYIIPDRATRIVEYADKGASYQEVHDKLFEYLQHWYETDMWE